jgi:ubiquitin-protein ligase
MNPRQRRLAADYAELAQAFDSSRYVHIEPVGPLPPERYRLTYRVPGLRLNAFGQAMRVHEHHFEITLPSAYPRQQPYVVPLSPVFHPNISSHVCIADFWSPSQSLLDTVVQIADMLQFLLYNINSPLDAVAARWVEQNGHQIPVGRVRVRPAEARPVVPSPAPPIRASRPVPPSPAAPASAAPRTPSKPPAQQTPQQAWAASLPPVGTPPRRPQPTPEPEGETTVPMRVHRPAQSAPNAEGS